MRGEDVLGQHLQKRLYPNTTNTTAVNKIDKRVGSKHFMIIPTPIQNRIKPINLFIDTCLKMFISVYSHLKKSDLLSGLIF